TRAGIALTGVGGSTIAATAAAGALTRRAPDPPPPRPGPAPAGRGGPARPPPPRGAPDKPDHGRAILPRHTAPPRATPPGAAARAEGTRGGLGGSSPRDDTGRAA